MFSKVANHKLFFLDKMRKCTENAEHVFFLSMKCTRKIEPLKCMFHVKMLHGLGDNLSWVLRAWVWFDQEDEDIKGRVAWRWSIERDLELILPHWIKICTFKSNFTNDKFGFTFKTRFRE